MIEYVTYEQNNNMCYEYMKDFLDADVKCFNHLSKEAQAFILNVIIYDAIEPSMVNDIIDNVAMHEARGDYCDFKASYDAFVRGEDYIILFEF